MAKKRDTKKDRKRIERRRVKKAMAPNAHLRDRKRSNLPPGFARFTDDDYLFWIAHGINYLVSNYEEGVWDPLFDGLYEGRVPDSGAIERAILKRYPPEGEEPLSPEARPVLACAAQDKSVIFIVSREVERAVRKHDRKCDVRSTARKPKHPAVWETFESIRTEILATA